MYDKFRQKRGLYLSSSANHIFLKEIFRKFASQVRNYHDLTSIWGIGTAIILVLLLLQFQIQFEEYML